MPDTQYPQALDGVPTARNLDLSMEQETITMDSGAFDRLAEAVQALRGDLIQTREAQRILDRDLTILTKKLEQLTEKLEHLNGTSRDIAELRERIKSLEEAKAKIGWLVVTAVIAALLGLVLRPGLLL